MPLDLRRGEFENQILAGVRCNKDKAWELILKWAAEEMYTLGHREWFTDWSVPQATRKQLDLSVQQSVCASGGRCFVSHNYKTNWRRSGCFAALVEKEGRLVTWGEGDAKLSAAERGLVSEGVKRVVPGPAGAFAALKYDGSVVFWPNFANVKEEDDEASDGDESDDASGDEETEEAMHRAEEPDLLAALSSGVRQVSIAGEMYIAVKTDESVVIWGSQYTPALAARHSSVIRDRISGIFGGAPVRSFVIEDWNRGPYD